ncbi:MAG: CHASE2 domain-containing protein [Burkholderiales bacterium]
MSAPGTVEPHPAMPWSERRLVRVLAGGRGRPLGVVFLAVLLALTFVPEFGPVTGLRLAGFDAYQNLSPRVRESGPAIVVAIDEKSLSERGQWPWPRTELASLIEQIAAADPAAIGVDILFPEPDRMSPHQIARVVEAADADLARRLRTLPSNDALFARAISKAPVILGIAGLDDTTAEAPRGRTAPFLIRGADPIPRVRNFESAVRSIPEIDQAASGHALISVDPHGGIVRHVPLIGAVAGTLTPALSVEMLRVAAAVPAFRLSVGRDGLQSVSIGDLEVPTESDGTVWIRFGPRDASRFVSAADVLARRIARAMFERKLVLIGATALGLQDYQATPLGERMPGIEIHAQILENIFAHELLRRPAAGEYGERLLLLACGIILVVAVPSLRARSGACVFMLLLITCVALGFGLFVVKSVLFDVGWPVLGTTLVYGALLGGTLADADRQRRALAKALVEEREAAARAAGELEAARRIQIGMLPPNSAAFYRDHRFELDAMLETAESVGGDLYDYFKLDADRLFFLVGDVSGNGLPASIFMAVSKALYKSTVLRESGDIGRVMRAAQEEIARDNPEAFFVTVFAALLELSTGQLEYCNAGHEPPLCAGPDGAGVQRLEAEAGPPLCVLDRYQYRTARHAMTKGELICLVTDGITEAMDMNERLYGRERLASLVASRAEKSTAGELLQAIREDVERYCSGAKRSDDTTILVLRWNGAPAARSQ